MPPEPWKLLHSHRDKSYRVFSLRTDRAVSPRTGLDHDFFILESSAWVNIIPLTRENHVILVRQYRHGIRDVTLEIPGGLVENNDSPMEAARRELVEETGYDAGKIEQLGFVHPNPAIQNNLCHTFLATDVFLSGYQEQDEKEDIEVISRPIDEIPRIIREGLITHSLVLAAFYRFFVEYDRSYLINEL